MRSPQMSKYMEHDLFRKSGVPEYIDTGERYFCRRCGASVQYEEYNVPCGVGTRQWWYDKQNIPAKGWVPCVERD